MTLVDRCPHGSSRRSIICDYTNAQGAVNVAQSTCHSGWLCSSLTPTLRLANAAPVSASTHLRALWSSVCTCGVSLSSATSSKLLVHRSTPLVEKPRRGSCFLPSRCGCPPHRCPAPYFEKQQARFTKGDLVSNPPTLAGVRAASRSSEFPVSSSGCTLPLPRHGRDCILDIASALIGLDALRLRRQLWSATFAPES